MTWNYRCQWLCHFLITGIFCFGSLPGEEASLDGREKIALTLYSNGMALIKELRHVTVKVGEGKVALTAVPAATLPDSIQLKVLDMPIGFEILEQSFAHHTADPEQLLKHYVGRQIELEWRNPYQDRTQKVEATLLSHNAGTSLYKIGDTIHFGHVGKPVLPISSDVALEPTVSASYISGVAGGYFMELSYLTEGLNWTADYQLILNGEKAILSSWATLKNDGEVSFRDAEVGLIAGDVHRAPGYGRKAYALRTVEARDVTSPSSPAPVFDYQRFPLGRRLDLLHHQSKKIQLLEKAEMPVKRIYLAEGAQSFYGDTMGREEQRPVQIYLEFKQLEKEGVPLPAGNLQAYLQEDSGRLQWIGEDKLPHTPTGELVKCRLGNAFDIITEQKQTMYTQLSSRKHSSSYAWTVRNRKSEAVTVLLQQRFSGQWQIDDASHEYKGIDASTIQFPVTVQANDFITVTYRVQVGI